MATILIVEDEELLAKNIKRALERLGHAVAVAGTCGEGERLFAEMRPDVTLLDLRLPDGSGLDLLPRLRERRAGADVLIMTAYATIEEAVSAIKLGARDYLQKPLHMEDVRHAVARTLEEGPLKSEVSYYRSREARGAAIDDILGSCAAIEELRARTRRRRWRWRYGRDLRRRDQLRCDRARAAGRGAAQERRQPERRRASPRHDAGDAALSAREVRHRVGGSRARVVSARRARRAG